MIVLALSLALLGCPAPPDATDDTGGDTDAGPGEPQLASCPQCVAEPLRPGVWRLQVFPPPDDWTIDNGAFALDGTAWVADNPSLGAVTTAHSGPFPLDAGWTLVEIEVWASGMSALVIQDPPGATTPTVLGGNTEDVSVPEIFQAGAVISGNGSDADPYVYTGEHTVEPGVSYFAEVEGAYDATLARFDVLFTAP